MKYRLSPSAEKQLSKSSNDLQKKFTKQLRFLLKDPRYPSLRSRKMEGENKFEARIDFHNRFTYLIDTEEILILTIGPHHVGLGKK